MYIVLYCGRFHRHATLPLTNTAILTNINNQQNLQTEEQIPIVCNLYGEKNTQNITLHHVCSAVCYKKETAIVPSTESKFLNDLKVKIKVGVHICTLCWLKVS
jgi:hypothetical protein